MSTTFTVDDDIVDKARQKFEEVFRTGKVHKDAWVETLQLVVDDYAKSIGAYTEVTASKVSDDQEITEEQIEIGREATSGEGISREEIKEILVAVSQVPASQREKRISTAFHVANTLLGRFLESKHVFPLLENTGLIKRQF